MSIYTRICIHILNTIQMDPSRNHICIQVINKYKGSGQYNYIYIYIYIYIYTHIYINVIEIIII